jgi:hypothetical protein
MCDHFLGLQSNVVCWFVGTNLDHNQAFLVNLYAFFEPPIDVKI